MSNSERLALFVDGQNLHHATKNLGFAIDFKRLLFEFQRRGTIVRSYYYTSISENADQSVRSLVDWLDYNGFDLAPKFYPVLSSPLPLDLPCWAVGATGAGAEPSA